MTYRSLFFRSASLAAFLARLNTTAERVIKASGHSFSPTRLNNLSSSAVIRTMTGMDRFPAIWEFPTSLESWQENCSFQVKLKILAQSSVLDNPLQSATNGPFAPLKSLDGAYASVLKSFLLHPPTGPAICSSKSVLSRSPQFKCPPRPSCTRSALSPPVMVM